MVQISPTSPMSAVTAIPMSTALIDLKWTPDTNAQYYQVFRDTSAGFTPSEDNLVVDDLTLPSFADDEISAGTTYYYEVYAIGADGAATLIGQTPASTPATDSPLYALPGGGSGGNGGGGNPAPSHVQVTGINDMELMVSWTDNAANPSGFLVQVSTNQSDWYTASDGGSINAVGANATTFIVRQICINDTLQYLQLNTQYYVRVEAINTNGISDAVVGASPAELFVNPQPGFSATIVVGGGRGEEESWLESQWNTWLFSVGGIAGKLASQGFNVFLTADDAADGGAINLDGTGLVYDELLQAIARGGAGAIGLIGYSWGGGVVNNMSNLLWNQQSSLGNTWVVYAGTIDAINNQSWLGLTPSLPTALKISPADQWESSLLGQNFSMGTNYWEPKGDATFGIVGGASMTGAEIFEINNDDHSTIGTDQTVLNDVYQDALQAFLLLGF